MSSRSGSRQKRRLADRSIIADEPRDRISNKRRATRPGQSSRRRITAEDEKSARPVSARTTVLVDLALQGGGSHGAFTWGVLDRLLEESWLQIDAISGTSAGAMNAAVLVDGWVDGGRAGARTALDAYWGRVAQAAVNSPLQRTLFDRMAGRWTLELLADVHRL